MTHLQRRRLTRSALRGILLAVVAMLLQAREGLVRLDHAFYDLRVAHCQRYRPPPSNKFVHLDIDETALSGIGTWPWPRDLMADLLDEIGEAKPKLVTMDILFGDRPSATSERELNGAGAADPDEQFGAAIKRLGNVLLPISVSFQYSRSAGAPDARLLDLLAHDPELTVAECVERLRKNTPVSPTLQADVEHDFRTVRPQAIFKRISEELDRDPKLDLTAMHKRLLPDVDPLQGGSILRRLLREEYDRAMRFREIRRFALPPSDQSLPILQAAEENENIPRLPLCRAVAHIGFANYVPDNVEGAVRSVPLLIEDRGRVFPQMALVAACAALDVDVRSLRLSEDSVIIPRPGQADIQIPVSYRQSTGIGRPVAMLMEIPLFGPQDEWQAMYDFEQRRRPLQHISIYAVYQACVTRQRITANEVTTDGIVLDVLNALNPDNPKEQRDYSALVARGADRSAQIRRTLERMNGMIEGMAGDPDLDKASRDLLTRLQPNRKPLQQLVAQTDALRDQLGDLRGQLRAAMNDKVVFIGGAAGVTDFYPTSLHYSCPGVVIHGAIFNAIMTGKMWRRADRGVDAFVTLGIGLLVAALVTLLTPIRAFIATVLLVGLYLIFNGYVLFDRENLIVADAGPVVAGLLVWGILTLVNFITEKRERARITSRFRSYVDPALVDFVISHPEQSRFTGEIREMSMGFTDLAGFTAMTEKLKEKAIPLLSDYMSQMIPVIRANQGYVSCLMGDGIYFFYGAPLPDPDHAAHAVATVVDMRKALAAFNERLAPRGLPKLDMRAGVTTGMVVIGDAGPPDCSDYTAMGDSVNLASRLESANKAFGSHVLITRRTLDLIGDTFLVRPIALLQVQGKTEGINVYEPMARHAEATDQQRAVAEATTAAVTAYQGARFADTLAALMRLEAITGTTKLILLYRRHCEAHASDPPESFTGQVVLSEK
jgi:class 3 adenylate cyclase